MNKLFRNVVLIMTIMVFAACGKKEAEVETIKIGHKNYTEQRVLGQLFAVMIESHTDYKTDVKELGGTKITFEALKSGDINLYPEFSGTAYVALLNESGLKDPDKVHKLVKDRLKAENNLDYLNPLGYNNTYTLAVRAETAEKYNLKTFSDIAKVSGELSGQISETEMQQMNYRADEEGVPTKIVAEEFLKKKGLL